MISLEKKVGSHLTNLVVEHPESRIAKSRSCIVDRWCILTQLFYSVQNPEDSPNFLRAEYL